MGGYSEYKHCLVWNGLPASETKLLENEAKRLILNSNAWMLRNCYNWDCDIETNFWEVICDKFYRIDELPSKTRNQIRRCLRDCNIKKLTAIELINSNGYKVYKEAFNRYHDIAVTIPSKSEWERGIVNDSTHEFWGVFEKETEELIAWAMNTVSNEYVNF